MKLLTWNKLWIWLLFEYTLNTINLHRDIILLFTDGKRIFHVDFDIFFWGGLIWIVGCVDS